MSKQVNGKDLNPVKRPVGMSRYFNRRARTDVRVGNGEPDSEMLSAVIREWIMPLLVRQFLAERGVEAPQGQNQSGFSKSVYRDLSAGGTWQEPCERKLMNDEVTNSKRSGDVAGKRRAAVYTRFSKKGARETSTEDQIRECSERQMRRAG